MDLRVMLAIYDLAFHHVTRARAHTPERERERERERETMSSSSLLRDHLVLLPVLQLIIIITATNSWWWSPALSASTIVTHLPGFSGPLPFYLETGYVEVDEVKGVELFYYFIQSEGNPREDPLILWLTGGPGCSGLSGLVFEIGPIKLKVAEYDGSLPTLLYNQYSWTKVANIIFLDSPVGTGFSFARDSEVYETGDIPASRDVHSFLIKWFVDHPLFLSNHLYIGGDSYAGKLVPVVVEEILEGTKAAQSQLFNLKGYLVGNPRTSEQDFNYRIPFAHGMAIISDELYQLATRSCEGEDYENPRTEQCAKIFSVIDKFISENDKEYILEPKCDELSKTKEIIGNRRSLKENNTKLLVLPPLPADITCRSYGYCLLNFWANNDVTRKALNVKKGTVGEWTRCNSDIQSFIVYKKDIPSVIKYHLRITTKGYRALVYSGDHDMVFPFLGTQAWIRSLNFSIVDDWRSWRLRGQVAGYTITYANNMTFATVKGAGHLAPKYRPKECFAMFRRWISSKPL